MNFDDLDKRQNQPDIRHLPQKRAHGDVTTLPNHAHDNNLAKIALTDDGWKALIKIQRFIRSLPMITDRRQRDRKAVKLLVKEIIELKSRFKVLGECKKALQKESETLQGGITVSRMTVFRQMCFADSCVLINILEFAASFENVSSISKTCREWNEIINKNKLTSESIWHRIAHQQYSPHEFEELEQINPLVDRCYFPTWKTILEIKAGSKWKVFQGEVGGTIQRLFWVFHGRLLPYRHLVWFDDRVVCRLSIQSEISIRFRDNEAVWNKLRRSNRGIWAFDVSIHDHFIQHIDDVRIIDVLYRDHDYTVSNFDEQRQIIHQWFNVWGLSEQDYEIAEPERQLGIRYIHNVGIIRVKILTSVSLPF